MGIAKATLPNVCKMPGPPAPFVPSPLPNIATSGTSPKGYSRRVKIERNPVAIRGASFKSMGDIASKATGGGLLSMNTHGPAKFITLGSPTVKIEGKSVHLLSEPMLNNLGASGSPPNTGATLGGLLQAQILSWNDRLQQYVNQCDQEVNNAWDKNHPSGPKHTDCKAPSGQVDAQGKSRNVKKVLGEMKHDCVYGKMGVRPGQTSAPDSNGNTATVEQRFLSDGTPAPTDRWVDWTGTIRPDIIYRRANGSITAIRDLKFPCPSSPGTPGTWTRGQRENYTRILRRRPTMIYPR